MFVLIRRVLNDFEAWKEVVSEPDDLRAQYGSRGLTAYRSADNPNEVLVVLDWDDDKPYSAYLNLPEVQSALAATGTTEVTAVTEVFTLPA